MSSLLAGPVASAALVVAFVVGPASAAPLPATTAHFAQPDAIAVTAGGLFVADKGSNSLTEVNASTGAIEATVRGSAFRFDAPTALASLGGHLFVANAGNDTVTEITESTRSLVRVIAGASHSFAHPIALATDGTTYLYVLSAGGVVTELSAASGALTGVNRFGLDHPDGMTLSAGHVFVSNAGDNSVIEYAAATLGSGRRIAGASYKFSSPAGIVSHSGLVFVVNRTGQSVTEFQATTAQLVQVIPNTDDYLPSPGPAAFGDGDLFVASPPGGSPMVTQVVPTNPASLPWMMCNTNGPYTFSNPQAMAVSGGHLWVVNEGGAGGPVGNSLTEMDASSGALIRVVR